MGESAEEGEGAEEFVDLHGFEGGAGDHGLAFEVMEGVVVGKAAEVLFEDAAAAVEGFDDEDGAGAPVVFVQWLFISPDGDASAVVGEEEGGEARAGGHGGGEGVESFDAEAFEGGEGDGLDEAAALGGGRAPDGGERRGLGGEGAEDFAAEEF